MTPQNVLVRLGCQYGVKSSSEESSIWGTKFQVYEVLVERPTYGSLPVDLACPGCGKAVQVSVMSRRSMQIRAALSALVPLNPLALGGFLRFAIKPEPAAPPTIALRNCGECIIVLSIILSMPMWFLSLMYALDAWELNWCRVKRTRSGEHTVFPPRLP